MADRSVPDADITAWVDIDAPPPPGQPTAHLIFGTNQLTPAVIAGDRHQAGLAPMIILTGGINRHTGIIEAEVFRDHLTRTGVPDDALRWETTSTNTWENVQNAAGHLREARAAGLPITIVAKWYHRRTVHILKTLLPDVFPCYAITWDPRYDGEPVTRTSWPRIPSGRRRVLREWEETRRRIADGSFTDTAIHGGAWS